jgi:hypothetical protein
MTADSPDLSPSAHTGNMPGPSSIAMADTPSSLRTVHIWARAVPERPRRMCSVRIRCGSCIGGSPRSRSGPHGRVR